MTLYALPMFEIQTAIYQKLTNSATLMSLVQGVFDTPDVNEDYPYVTISEPYSSPLDTKTNNNETITFTMHAWYKDNDDYTGKKITYQILSACQQALSTRNYNVPGVRVLDVSRVEAKVFDDNTAGVKHGILRMRYKIQNM